jgi:DNA-binding winged helix-turn-helix (wHTH) protein/tetratricopeptide (TPR) repeat protein
MKAFAPFRLDPVNQCLWRDDARISVTPKVFAVLTHLVEHADRLVTQDELLEAIWPDTYVQPEVLRKYVLELRKILGDRPKDPLFIATYPKRGYQFVAKVTEEPPASRASHGLTSVAGDVTRDTTQGGAGKNGIAVTAPLAERSANGVAPVGRAKELEQLQNHLEAALGGQRRLVYVTGEAGVGKTTLIDAFQEDAGVRGLRIARGQCVEGFGGQEAYYPVLEAVGQMVRAGGVDSVASFLAKVAPTWLIQFPQFLKPGQREELQREILGATRERMVRELCEAIETLTAETPLVMILEDLHWADTSTLDLVSALARRRGPARFLLLMTYRPVDVILRQSPLKTLKQDLQVHRLSAEVPLERLSEQNVAEYLSAEFPGADLPETLANLIHRHSDGNPMFMTALASELVDQGVLKKAVHGWGLTRSVDQIVLGVPDTLQQMIEMQVDQLSENEQKLLKAASVSGQRFSAWSVATVLGIDAASAEEVCEQFTQRQQFLRPGRGSNVIGSTISGTYEFRHSLYREALYRRLPLTQRGTIHSTLAEKAEAHLGVRGGREFAAELSLHFESARNYDRAAQYLLWAAENAALRYAHRDSIATLERALKLLSTAPTDDGRRLEIDILERISDAYYALGEMERSARIDERAATLAGERGLKAAQAEALTRSARALSFLDPDDCVTACERAVEVAASAGDPLLQARAQLLAACWRIINDGWTQRDADICEESRTKIRELQGSALPAYQEVLYAHVQCLQGEYMDSCATADAGLKRAEEIHSLVVYLSCLSSKALALMHIGWWGELRRLLERGIDLAKKNGNAPWAGIFDVMLAWLHLQSCDFNGARERALDILKRHNEEPIGQVQCIALLTLGYSHLATGRAHEALEPLIKVRDRQAKPKVFLQWYWRMISEFGIVNALLDSGDLETADTAAQIYLEEAQTTATPSLRCPAWDALARVADQRGDLKSAIECIGKALDEIDGVDMPSIAWRTHITASLLFAKAGNTELAEEHRGKSAASLLSVARSFEQDDPLQTSLLGAAAELRETLNQSILRAAQARSS